MLYVCATFQGHDLLSNSVKFSFLVQSAKPVSFPSIFFCFPPLILVLVDMGIDLTARFSTLKRGPLALIQVLRHKRIALFLKGWGVDGISNPKIILDTVVI